MAVNWLRVVESKASLAPLGIEVMAFVFQDNSISNNHRLPHNFIEDLRMTQSVSIVFAHNVITGYTLLEKLV